MSEQNLTFDQTGEISLIRMTGALDMVIIPGLKEEIHEHLNTHSRKIVVDIHDISYIDSSGIGLLIYIAKTVFSKKGRVKFIIPTGFVFDVLHMIHFDKLFEVYHDRARALKDFNKVTPG